MLESRPRVLFLHIPKTGGTTLLSILRRPYDAREVLSAYDLPRPPSSAVGPHAAIAGLDPAIRRRARLVLGHLFFGFHRYFPGPSTYVTFLRDPVVRILSEHAYAGRDEGHELHREVVNGMGPGDFVDAGLPWLDNGQTRLLAGPSGARVPFGACDAGLLARAKGNLEERFSFVGFTEAFDESVVRMQEVLGGGWPRYRIRNRSSHRRSPDNLEASNLDRIRERNRLDTELFQWAWERFHAGRTLSSRIRVSAFRLVNRVT